MQHMNRTIAILVCRNLNNDADLLLRRDITFIHALYPTVFREFSRLGIS
jgi:hypothetical protein